MGDELLPEDEGVLVARRMRSGVVDGGRYRHSGIYKRLLQESCHAQVFYAGLGLAEPDPQPAGVP